MPVSSIPKVSVVIPAYNCAPRIERALISIWEQDYDNIEIVVVNDGSSDNTEDILERYASGDKIRYKKTENRGVSHALNVGLELARGDYVSILHADDMFLPAKITRQLSLLEKHPRYDVSYTNEEYFMEGTDARAESPFAHFSGDIFYFLKRSNFIHISTTMFRRDIFKRGLAFDETLACHEDWDLFLTLSVRGAKFLFVNQALSRICMRPDNLSSNTGVMDLTREEVGLRAKRLWKSFKREINLHSASGLSNLIRYSRFKLHAMSIGFPKGEKFNALSPREILWAKISSADILNNNTKDRCDIVIPVWNQLELTKVCLDSIKANTRVPYRLILIDNGSEDSARSYLESLRQDPDQDTVVIRNEENAGFVKAVNQGMRVSDAPYVCVMNNDTTATDGWLQEMIDLFRIDPGIGIVNPSSNTFGQSSGKLDTETYARTLRALKGKYQELFTARAFAMVVKREVIERIGYMDESFGMGYFDDTDYSKRAQGIGYKTVRAKAAYVYHKGSQSFSAVGETAAIFRDNENRFISKWGKRLRVAYVLPSAGTQEDTARISHNINRIVKIGHETWIFTVSRLNENLKLIDHEGIRFFLYPRPLFMLIVLYKIWKRRRKKKIDAILTNNRGMHDIFRKFETTLGSDIFMDNGFPIIEKHLNNLSHAAR